jgi:voltage-gated potassium channel
VIVAGAAPYARRRVWARRRLGRGVEERDVDERSRRVARWFELPVLVAALLVIPLLVLEGSDLGEPWTTVAAVLNWGTWLVFFAEVVTMLAVVPDRWRWLREHPADVIATVLSPPVLPAALAAARLLRLLRVLRLLRLVPILQRVFTLAGVRYAALLAVVTLLAGGTAFAQVEKAQSEWDGIWWAATTMTTVGYGDLYPHTTVGRVIGLIVMVVGIGFGSLLVGLVAERFVYRDVQQETAEVERDVDATQQELLGELRALSARVQRIEAAILQPRR